MSSLSTKRHSLAHLMAHAVKDLWPKVKFAIGPDIDSGWYYDIDFGKEKISEEDFPKLEERIRELISQSLDFKNEKVY